MSEIWNNVLSLITAGEIRVSEHGYDELAADDIFVKDIIAGIRNAELLEDYPSYPKGPCVLVLLKDRVGAQPIHVVWGIPTGLTSPTVLVTA